MTIFSNNYIEFDGAYYVIDMDALSKYIVGDDDEKVVERTKNEQWVASQDLKRRDLDLISKDITETSSVRKDINTPYRAEIVKTMLTLIMYPTVDGNGEAKEITSLSEPFSFGQAISFNTLISEGIIKEIQMDETDEQ